MGVVRASGYIIIHLALFRRSGYPRAGVIPKRPIERSRRGEYDRSYATPGGASAPSSVLR